MDAEQRDRSDVLEDQRPSVGVVRLRVVALSHSQHQSGSVVQDRMLRTYVTRDRPIVWRKDTINFRTKCKNNLYSLVGGTIN